MEKFIEWFNKSAPDGKEPLTPLVRAGIAHIYFGKTNIDAQKQTIKQIDFIINKAKFFDTHKESLNPRQLKVINRILAEGPKGFDGGFSAKNYRAITKSPAATATRDLQDLVSKAIFSKTGQLQSTRYILDLSPFLGK